MSFLLISIAVSLLLHSGFIDVSSLFNDAAGLVAFFFIIVCVLIFIFIYDNLRRQKRTTAPTTT